MKLFKLVRNQVILVGLIGLAGYGAYQLLLDDEAKRSLAMAGQTVKQSYDQLAGLVNERIGMIMDEDLIEQNRQKIRDDWAELGL